MAASKKEVNGYNHKCDVWSLAITAIELAEMRPPMGDVHPMRALFLIPRTPPPTLRERLKWTKQFHLFLAESLVKDPAARPEAATLRRHGWFAFFNPPHSVCLRDLVDRPPPLSTTVRSPYVVSLLLFDPSIT